jgi:hypothetical protein
LNSNTVEMYSQPNAAAAEYLTKDVVPLLTAIAFTLPQGSPPGNTVTLPLDTALQFSTS